jgi:hypothetical protein
MKLAGLHLRQRDGVTCGPSVAVVGGALLDPKYRAKLASPESRQAWFASEQLRVHTELNRMWPRTLGTTPMGIARALTERGAAAGVRYRWRAFRGRPDHLSDVLRALDSGLPVAMLIGRVIPRHWVLIVAAVGDELECYEPSSGEVRPVAVDAVRRSRLTGLGYPRPFAFVVPRSAASLPS